MEPVVVFAGAELPKPVPLGQYLFGRTVLQQLGCIWQPIRNVLVWDVTCATFYSQL